MMASVRDTATQERIQRRVQYYYRLPPFNLPAQVRRFRLKLTGGQSAYQIDFYRLMRYFDPDYRVTFEFGDVRRSPPIPAFVKSRPIADDIPNAVLLKLNSVRHFRFVRDPIPFEDKTPKLVWRGSAAQAHRKDFLRSYFGHPLCDVGHYHPRRRQEDQWRRPRLSIADQLRYRFILAIEGNDIASNLKWIMSSGSLCFMPPCRNESWFMEGRLRPGVHYVALRSDYADLPEKIEYYTQHTAEARAIVHEANAWVEPFRNPVEERITGLLVMWKYFHGSGQLPDPPPLD